MQDISRDVAESEKLRNVDFFVVIIMSHGKYGTYGYRTYVRTSENPNMDFFELPPDASVTLYLTIR